MAFRRCVHLHLIPIFIRSHVLISLIVMQPLDRVIPRSVILRSDETIRLSGDGNRGGGGEEEGGQSRDRRRCRGPRRITTNLFGCYSCRNYEIQCGEFAC